MAIAPPRILYTGPLALLLALAIIPPAWPDSPITHTRFHEAYSDIENIQRAPATGSLDAAMVAFLLDAQAPIDQRLALVSAVGDRAIEDGDTARLVEALAVLYDWRRDIVTIDLSGRQSAVLGYLLALENPWHPEWALPYLERAVAQVPNSLAVRLIHALVTAQIHLDYHWCGIWSAYVHAVNQQAAKQDIRTAAIVLIQRYARLYEKYCLTTETGGPVPPVDYPRAVMEAPTLLNFAGSYAAAFEEAL